MAEQGKAGFDLLRFPARRVRPAAPVGDLRFRTLIGEEAWNALPEPVRRRFGKRIAAGAVALYAGEIVECRLSRLGRLLAQLARLIGGPLPIRADIFVPAAVAVTEDPASGGQIWTRVYGRARGFPQVINSCKSFSGPTGLEERIGAGFGIALTVAVEGEALHFDSDHYFLMFRGRRLRIPRWLAPGRLRVSHVHCAPNLFAFVLSLDHPWLGALVRQTAMFSEREERQ